MGMGKGERRAPTVRAARPARRAEHEELVVHFDSAELGGDQVIGRIKRASSRGTTVLSFAFDEAWLASRSAFELDPGLNLVPGDQYTFPRIFADTTPDRWGRTLLERDIIRVEGRARTLDDWDLLVLVRDELRMGALRFARPEDGAFVAVGSPSVPPVARLSQIEEEVREVERGGAPGPAVADLVAPGSPLGGNRPKANFFAADGSLWMAKFPSATDRWDFAGWEYLLNGLAGDAGIPVPETQLLGPYLGPHHTFAARRFDRDGMERRLFASALTLTAGRDHADASYLDIAQAIERYAPSGDIGTELEQLFRRVVFNVVTGHRDDHLRNHGFLRTGDGWRLSPAYDLNPRHDARLHELAFERGDKEPSLERVLATADYYRVAQTRADQIMDEVRSAVAPWRDRATALGLPRAEVLLMEAAFSV
ncbi:MAG: type II toxin-antitoxin system HipA family toxin [Acidobacteria bacterium]|nr:type II toxin-antitoxin system HipA family toxin [Acidobacteriota bacterium]